MPQKIVDVVLIRRVPISILLVEKDDVLILPGGKSKHGESDLECLIREIEEELPGTELDMTSVRYYKRFTGISPKSNNPIEVEVYFAVANKIGAPDGQDNIQRKAWYSYGETGQLSETTREIVESLHRDGYLLS